MRINLPVIMFAIIVIGVFLWIIKPWNWSKNDNE